MKREIQKFVKNNIGKIITILLFLTLLPLANKVNFYQNDDWYYYEQVEQITRGNFQLNKDIAPTFYLMGILGALFAKLFTIEKLPILTLLISTLNFYIVFKILKTHMKKGLLPSILLSLLVFFNPLHTYSTWGFMTENYFLFFTLWGLYLFLNHINFDKKLGAANIVILCSLLIRQLGFAYYLASSAYFILRRNFTKAMEQIAWFISLYFIYQTFFPKTQEMLRKSLQIKHLFNLDYSYAIISGTLIYAVAFLLPVIAYFISNTLYKEKNNTRRIIGIILGTFILLVIHNRFFKPETVSWGEYPYFENTVERTGFYPRDIHGTKYQFKGIYDLYYYIEILAKVGVCASVILLLLIYRTKFSKMATFFAIFLVIYLATVITAETFYDRYLVPLIPLIMFLICSIEVKRTYSKALYIFLIPSLILSIIISYTFTQDYIKVESYVWNKSKWLVESGVRPKEILSTSAWNEKHERSREPEFIFSYDSESVNPDLGEKYKLVETYIPDYPLNLHIKPKVYLYQKTD